VKKLLAFNSGDAQRVEVVILSKNDPVSGQRIFRSAERAGLRIERGVFTRGRSPYRYLDALRANLFLSANEQDVRGALEAQFPVARVLAGVGAGRRPRRRGADRLRRRLGAVLRRSRARVPARRPGCVHQARDRARPQAPAAGHVPFGIANKGGVKP